MEVAQQVDDVEDITGHLSLDPESSSTEQDSISLEHYILRAENGILEDSLKRQEVFKKTSKYTLPMLQKGSPNNVLLFYGCFNPPHRGHLELLCHTFLRTNQHTIAAIIVPTDGCCTKDYQQPNGLNLKLDKSMRIRLWDDDILHRFAWTWPGKYNDVDTFINEIQDLTSKDGFDLSFLWLHGADHQLLSDRQYHKITSDITRPMSFLKYAWDEIGKPPAVKGWTNWKMASSATHCFVIKGYSHSPESPCWICWKIKKIFPEYLEKDFEEDPNRLAGFAYKIFVRCHEGQGITWSTQTLMGYERWFLFSGRGWPETPAREKISSTEIRRLIGTSCKEEVFDNIKEMALNPKLLLKELGLDQK